MAEAWIRVDVVCSEPGTVFRVPLRLPAGATAIEAVEAATARESHLPADLGDGPKLGIFSRRIEPSQVLEDGDRVEVYRPLGVDPKEARRRRAGRSG